MSKKITLENVDSSELPEIPVIGEVKQIRFTQDMELVSTLADSDLFMIQAGADLEARPNTITFDLIIKNLSGPIEEGSKKFVTGDMMFKVIGDMNLLDTWDNTNLVSSLNATYVNVRRIEEELRREINRSTGKDDLHDTQIANLRQDLTSTNEMLNQEINRSVAKDNEHDELLEGLRDDVDSTSAKLDAEIDRSTAKDAEHDTLLKGLRVDVNANKSAIDSEVARSTARDEAHDAAISKNASDIATETSRAKAEEAKIRQEMQAADTNLQNAITAETERATGVEEDLQRQITDLSGSTDDRLEALEALSHEQNTDTGTTSKTFVIDSGNTGAMLKAEGGGLSTRTKGDAGYANFTVQNLVIKGDVTQEGDTFITQAERVEVRDNMILINEGETGAGVTAGFAGIEVDRGTEQNFMFGFNESDGMFKIGKEGNMFDVALRQPVGDMTDGMFASWDAATKTFKTTNLIPPTLQLYLGVPEVSIKYLSSDDGSIKFMTNGEGWSAFTSSIYTNFRSDKNKFQFIGELGVSTGIYDTIDGNFTIRTKGSNVLLLNKSKSVLNSSLAATSFFRSSDNAEVLYSLDQSSLTDGMFLSWDATNKKVVTTNMVKSGSNLYFGIPEVSIRYVGSDGGLLKFMTNNNGWTAFTNSSVTNFRSDANEFQFVGNIQIYNGKLYFTGGTEAIIYLGSSTKLLINNELSTFSTTVKASSFFRSSDDSEVLYQADLKSVLTGKETNYAPSVKAVSDAIESVNTGTTELLKGYLKLSGGTMTGAIKIADSGDGSTALTGIEDTSGRILMATYNNGINNLIIGSKYRKSFLRSSGSSLIHERYDSTGTNLVGDYSIYDSYNLPDPATKSGNNAFTGANSFVANKFSVGNFKVDINSSLEVNLPYKEGQSGWSRSLYFKYNNLEDTKVSFGSMGSPTVANYAYIGIGNISYDNAQYKFAAEYLCLDTTFRIDFGDASVISTNKSNITFGSNKRSCYVRSNDTDLFHTKNSTNYKIWDASNLPTPASTSDIPDVSDMAKKSEANTFTAQNTFTAGQFNVGPFEVTNLGSLSINMSNSTPWERYLIWSNNSAVTSRIMFGGYGNGDTANYAWIGIGDVNYTNAQYIFAPTNMQVPLVWSLDDPNGNSLVWSQAWDLVNFGRSVGTTKIRSGNVDLIHKKGSTDYKILDESNYSQYLPTTSKWTYGFVYENKTAYDLNTDLLGPDKGKLAYNYTGPSYWTNGPTGMQYGTVLQIWGSGSGANTPHLMPQLAFDVNHDIANSTRYMYFRTANNLGYGDSSNWKRVVTADENVAVYQVDSSEYPSLKYINGPVLSWLRAPQAGFLPNTKVSIASGGAGSIGTSDWCFQNAYIANVYANKYYFGSTGVYLSTSNNNVCILDNGGVAKKLCAGSLLVSDAYSNEYLVPAKGIFVSGRIRSNSDMLVGYSRNITGGMLGYGLNYDNTFAVGMGSEYSSGALILYNLLNPNIGKAGYNVPVAVTGTPCYLKLADGTLKLGVGATKAYTAGEAVTINEYEMATKNWATNTFYPLAGKGYLSFDANGRPVMANNQGYSAKDKDGITREIMWVGPDNVIYMGNGGNSKAIIDIVFLYGGNGENALNVSNIVQKRDLAKYLPLTGGTITDGLSVGANGSQPININNTNASATEVSQAFRIGGTSKCYFGYTTSTGVYMQNSDSSIICVKSNGAYFGTSTNTLTKLLTSTDLSGYATQSWVTSQGYLKSHQTIYALTFAAGAFADKTFTPTSSAATVNIPTKTSHLTNDSGFLTSITKSMVTTALGYTPPTTNTTYSQATSSTLGLVKIGATGLAAKNYAVQLNSSGQMYVAVPWTDTNSTYSAATSSTYGLVKIGATGLSEKQYAVKLNSSGQMYVSVPWTDTDTNTHYTTRLYAGASGSATNVAISNPYLKVTDDNTYRNQVRFIGAGATSISSDASGNITITSTNTTYDLSSYLKENDNISKLTNDRAYVRSTSTLRVNDIQVVEGAAGTATGVLYVVLES